jgi:hypothetical protein
MPDLYAFRSVRSPRRAEPGTEVAMPLAWTEFVPSSYTSYARSHVEAGAVSWGGGSLLADLIGVASDPDPVTRAKGAKDAAEQYLALDEAVNDHMLGGGIDPDAGGGFDDEDGEPYGGQRVLALVDRLDRWLVARDNQPASSALDEWLAQELRAGFDLNVADEAEPGEVVAVLHDRQAFHTFSVAAWARLVDSLAAALLLTQRGQLAQRLTRLLLVFGVLEMRSRLARPLQPRETWPLLARRIPLLPDPPFPIVLPEQQVQLVRQATVSDLFVVRQEWRCYVTGEIADIRNVLAGEHHLQETTRVDEREVLEVAVTEEATRTETASETVEESSFAEQTHREMGLALHADGQVDVTSVYGPTKVDASAGFSADFSLSEAMDRATQLAQRATARAASTVESRTRTERTERLLTRFQDVRRHQIDNDGEHARGVYRWVNRVDRLQVWRYPDRLQLEIQLPEPGRFLLAQLSQPRPNPAAVQHPGAFNVTASAIDTSGYLDLAAQYGATGMPEPPEETVGISAAFTVKPTEAPPNSSTVLWNATPVTERQEIAIPPGYEATHATVKVEATPLHAMWRREMEQTVGWEDLERFHTITASVAIGDQLTFDKQVGPDSSNQNSIQSSGTASDHPQFLEAHLHSSHGETAFTEPLAGKAPVAITVAGAGSATVAVELKCRATEQAKAAWRQDVFDALRAAYDLQLREWRAEQARLVGASVLAERAPIRHQEMIRAELKRHVVSWLLGESPFQGRPAVAANTQASSDVTPDINVAAALQSAPDIQFLEQCLEWTNITWVSYPYFWADRARWAYLADLDTVDPELGRFLRAGSVRVVAPVRPGFAGAMAHWLLYRQPWFGGPAPLPGSPLYVSIAQEIRDQAEPPPDGQPGDSWEIMLPTTLMWLDPNPDLPTNPLARLGQPPHEPLVPLCPGASGEVDDETPPDDNAPEPQ